MKFVHRLRAQDRDEMSQLVFDIARRSDRPRDFFTQNFAISLSKTMECLLHRILVHRKFTRDLGLRLSIVIRNEILNRPNNCALPTSRYSSCNRVNTCSSTLRAQRRSKIRSALKWLAGSESPFAIKSSSGWVAGLRRLIVSARLRSLAKNF